MKTFTEALGVIFQDETTREAALAHLGELQDLSQRYEAIIKEALENEAFQRAILMWESTVDQIGIRNALLTAFMNGMICGAEMEKTDIQGLVNH